MIRNREVPLHTLDALMAAHCGQRTLVGLIITEGTSPSPNGLGYPCVPGLFEAAQVQAWMTTTAAVHVQGRKSFVQVMHCGGVGHAASFSAGAEVLGPGTMPCSGEIATESQGMRPCSPPRAMSEADIVRAAGQWPITARAVSTCG